ncbi:MAG: Wzz/FepE/Etk N-terminal domain-containing protein, partial [Novosphingobium sp.]
MLSFADWVDAIRYRWKIVAAIAALFAVLGCLYIAVAPRSYRATSSLLLDIQGPDPTKESTADEKKVEASEVIATQVDLIKSPNVTDQAAATSGIAKDPAMVAKWRKDTKEEQPYQLWLRERLEKSLTVVPGDESHVLSIEAVAKTPEAAARIANGYAKASVAAQHRLRTDAARDYAAWLTKRLAGAKTEVVARQEALSSFARANGITNDGDVSSEGTQMAQVATQLAAAESAAAAARQSSFEAAQGRGDSERSSGVQELRTQLAQADSRYANLRAQFGPDYPDVKRAKAETETLQEQLNGAMATTTA